MAGSCAGPAAIADDDAKKEESNAYRKLPRQKGWGGTHFTENAPSQTFHFVQGYIIDRLLHLLYISDYSARRRHSALGTFLTRPYTPTLHRLPAKKSQHHVARAISPPYPRTAQNVPNTQPALATASQTVWLRPRLAYFASRSQRGWTKDQGESRCLA